MNQDHSRIQNGALLNPLSAYGLWLLLVQRPITAIARDVRVYQRY
jgi:hypothetical protein